MLMATTHQPTTEPQLSMTLHHHHYSCWSCATRAIPQHSPHGTTIMSPHPTPGTWAESRHICPLLAKAGLQCNLLYSHCPQDRPERQLVSVMPPNPGGGLAYDLGTPSSPPLSTCAPGLSPCAHTWLLPDCSLCLGCSLLLDLLSSPEKLHASVTSSKKPSLPTNSPWLGQSPLLGPAA